MNKKIFALLAALALSIGLLYGCGDSSASASAPKNNKQNNVVDVIQDQMDKADGKSEDAADAASEDTSSEKKEKTADPSVDVDLTAMSSTMVYSEVSNMMYDPEQYKGKKVKMEGAYSEVYDETVGKYYYACIIKDATACCAQGIEFELTSDYVYPEDYPSEDDEVTVIGTFDTYVEDNFMFCTLRDASLVS